MYGNEHSDSGCAVFVRTPAVQSEDAAGFCRCIENFHDEHSLRMSIRSSGAHKIPVRQMRNRSRLRAPVTRMTSLDVAFAKNCRQVYVSACVPKPVNAVVGYLAKHFRSRSAQTAGKVIGYLAKHCTTAHFKDREEQIVGTQEKPQ